MNELLSMFSCLPFESLMLLQATGRAKTRSAVHSPRGPVQWTLAVVVPHGHRVPRLTTAAQVGYEELTLNTLTADEKRKPLKLAVNEHWLFTTHPILVTRLAVFKSC